MDASPLVFDDWAGIGRVVVVGLCAYAALIAMLRVSGKRTLAKLNAFDLVVTVALGSTLASILLSGVPLAEGVTALALLIAMQFGVAFLSVRSRAFAKAVRSEPMLLVRDGVPCCSALRAARVTEAELSTVLRGAGQGDPTTVSAVILESDGSFSVLPQGAAETGVRRSGARDRA